MVCELMQLRMIHDPGLRTTESYLISIVTNLDIYLSERGFRTINTYGSAFSGHQEQETTSSSTHPWLVVFLNTNQHYS